MEIPGATLDFTDYSAPGTPRILNIPDAHGDVTVQDVWDTLSAIASLPENSVYAKLINRASSGGKNALSAAKQVGITCQMNNVQVKFEDLPGPTWTIKRVSDGNLTAVDHLGDDMEPLASSAFVNWKTEADVSAAVVETATSGLTPTEAAQLLLVLRVLINKQITDPGTGRLIVYGDDDVTPLVEADIFEDAAGTQPYQGEGVERRERLT